MKVKIKKLHTEAVIPQYAKPGDAGMDLTAVHVSTDQYGCFTYHTGLAVEIPPGTLVFCFQDLLYIKLDKDLQIV